MEERQISIIEKYRYLSNSPLVCRIFTGFVCGHQQKGMSIYRNDDPEIHHEEIFMLNLLCYDFKNPKRFLKDVKRGTKQRFGYRLTKDELKQIQDLAIEAIDWKGE